MTTTTDRPQPGTDVATELAHRAADGIDVLLLWDKEDGRLRVAVADSRTGESFELVARTGAHALSLFYHPFASRARAAATTCRLLGDDTLEWICSET